MTIADIVALLGFLMPLIWGVVSFLVRARETRNLAKQATTDIIRVRGDFNTLQREVDKHIIKIANLRETTHKHDSRITRLENHSINL